MSDKRRVVVVRCSQSLASYRRPGSFVIRESYPLPPYSSVIGMVHVACGFTEYVPMDVSVQGDCIGSISEPYKHYSFNRSMPYDEGRHNVRLDGNGKEIGITCGLLHIELLTDIELMLHILPEKPEMADRIAEGLRDPALYPSLGRHEDILRIDSVEISEAELCEIKSPVYLPHKAYIPADEAEKLGLDISTRFLLNKRFDIVKGRRVWKERVSACLTSHGASIETKFGTKRYVWRDSLGNVLFPA